MKFIAAALTVLIIGSAFAATRSAFATDTIFYEKEGINQKLVEPAFKFGYSFSGDLGSFDSGLRGSLNGYRGASIGMFAEKRRMVLDISIVLASSRFTSNSIGTLEFHEQTYDMFSPISDSTRFGLVAIQVKLGYRAWKKGRLSLIPFLGINLHRSDSPGYTGPDSAGGFIAGYLGSVRSQFDLASFLRRGDVDLFYLTVFSEIAVSSWDYRRVDFGKGNLFAVSFGLRMGVGLTWGNRK